VRFLQFAVLAYAGAPGGLFAITYESSPSMRSPHRWRRMRC
jgi:hypothetical protein